MDSVPVTFPCTAYYRAGFRIHVASPEEFEALPPGYSLSPFGPWPPPTFPCTVHYFDGFTVRVTSREEFAALRPGYRFFPGGPWPDVDMRQVPWKPGFGPFAPYPLVNRLVVFVEKEHVVARRPLVFAYAHVCGEVFRLDDQLTREGWLKAGHLDRFQKHLKETVWEYMDKRQDEDSPQIRRIQHNFPENLTPAKWRTRYERTQEEWGCSTWSEIILHVMEIRT